MYTIALSGPASTLTQAGVALENARIPVYPDDHYAPMDWRAKFSGEPEGTAWLTVEHADVNVPAQAVADAGWVLRVHYPTPEAPKPDPMQALAATVEEMKAEIAALKAGRA